MSKYTKVTLENGKWVITENGHDYTKPQKWCTFAFDTETQVYFDGKILDPKKLFKKVKNLNNEQKRMRLKNVTWAWQVYDEVNGFFMTNDFEQFLIYQCRAGLKFGWCYNSTFDFAQIDYEILATGKDKWTPHKHEEKGSGKGYNKGQAWTYESIHNDMGARYAYKLWVPYKHYDRHEYVHAVEYRDFMKLVTGGLRKLLEDLNVVDLEGNPIRKLEMEYQAVNTDDLTEDEIDYCANDVKGLYFAIKQFNETIEAQSNNECHIFGENTNLMTAGGFAKHELLRSLYPNIKKKRARIKAYQKDHPITQAQDGFVRANHLYRGGISYVNPFYKGKLLEAKNMNGPMYRYDVNSEYPYCMAIINDLIGKPITRTLKEYDAMSQEEKAKYEAVFILTSVYGDVKHNYLGLWYDPFRKDFVEHINEEGMHLMFERELNEMAQWYDNFEYACEKVILWTKGKKAYAPFVNENYELKAQAKKDHNQTLQTTTKLKLTSSYGKLAERLERIKGHYELNKETGAIHFVREEAEIDLTSSMNVVIGALVTCVARCYILSKIREVCNGDIKHKFVYIDTDSIHAFASYDKADAFALGGLKLEATCEAVKYIAPKTYIDIEKVNKDNTIDYDAFEVHSKGINRSAIIADLKKKQKGKKNGRPTLALIDRKINYGAKYICLVAMNVQGGKVLIPTEKYLARLELAPNADDKIVFTNYEGGMFSEV
jgi:hypothetical protein